MKHIKRLPILIVSVVLAVFLPIAAHADNVLLAYPFLAVNGLYTDNVGFSTDQTFCVLTPCNPIHHPYHFATTSPEGDFNFNFAAGFYLDFTNPDRHTSLNYSTFASLFLQNSQLDRAGQAQFFRFNDQENISPNTRLTIDNWFLRDSPESMAVITTDQPISLNPVFAAFFLANNHSIVNFFRLDLAHSFNRDWTGDAQAEQEVISSPYGNTSLLDSVSLGAQRSLSSTFSMGPGYKFYDMEFTLSSEPNSQAHWPVADFIWMPIENMRMEGYVGPIVAYNTSGVNRTRVDPGGIFTWRYQYRHMKMGIDGGQEPGLSAGIGAGGITRLGSGDFTWDLTKTVRFDTGGGYYEFMPPGADAKFFSYGAGLSQRVSSWMVVYARYLGFQREYSGAPVALPTGITIGQTAVANYYMIGATFAVEAFRWSWQ
ncbi:MAG TPA: hypothetical protein VMU16_07050 [Candidatus Binataceae bacterium]|nr:hypothetical protein [Candidatus Binataceae bacterium]